MAEDQASAAPKIKPGSTAVVTIKATDPGKNYCTIEFPNGHRDEVHVDCLADLPWQPPAPVLRVGGRARNEHGDDVTVLHIGKDKAMYEDIDGEEWLSDLADLTPLEDEG
jgi:hypothetical protein